MSKSMDTPNKSCTRIRKCIDNDKRESGYIPGQQAIMRYQERGVSAQLRNNSMHVREQDK